MNPKVKAGVLTVAFGAVCVAVGLTVQYVAQFMTPDQFMTGVAVAGITACIYMIYSVLLAHFEYKDYLKRQVDKK